MKSTVDEVKQFWDTRAKEYGTDARATLHEMPLRQMEIRTISKYLKKGARVIDIGCGNGYSTLKFAKRIESEFLGIDYSSEMIDQANRALALVHDNSVRKRVHFQTADILNLELGKVEFDFAVTERCIQNLPSWELQIQAVKQIARILVPGGTYLMNECSLTGLRRLNHLRNRVGKPALEGIMPWHNLFIEDDKLAEVTSSLGFELQKIVDWSSTYMILTKVINARFRRFSPLIACLPSALNCGYNRLYILVRKNY